MKQKKQAKDLLFPGIILILVAVMLYSGLRILEATVLPTGGEEQQAETHKTITHGGIDYFPRQDITTILILGIDRYGKVEDSGAYNNRGAADMDVLAVIDHTAGAIDLLYLNRDTMVEMPVLGLGGRRAGTYFGQLALAHTYGTGLHDSCENVVTTVSDLLGGIRIDYYAAMNMDAIAILNDGVGGVTVNVTEDFSSVDPSITRGTLTLRGNQAVNYVRTRKDVGDQLNLSRIQRQKGYIDSFVKAFRARYETDPEVIVSLYEDVYPYLVTNCSMNALRGMIDRCSDFEIREVVSPEGENVLGEKYFEFYADEEALTTLTLRLFFAPKE